MGCIQGGYLRPSSYKRERKKTVSEIKSKIATLKDRLLRDGGQKMLRKLNIA